LMGDIDECQVGIGNPIAKKVQVSNSDQRKYGKSNMLGACPPENLVYRGWQ
jgi:hypothetical protein